MKKLQISTFLLLLIATFNASAQKGKTILAIFAHPDDEEWVAPVLAKYAAEGASVYLTVATDGRFGVTQHAKILAGDTLAVIRAGEVKCACEQLGIHPPILMGIHDGLDMQQGETAEVKQLNQIRDRIVKLFAELKPDVVITWGPGGWTGHTDHRLISDIVTQVFTSTHWDKPVRLYYPGLPPDSPATDGVNEFAIIDTTYLTVEITLSAAAMAKANAAWHCHKSQYTEGAIAYLKGVIWNEKNPVSYFRPFILTQKKQHTLFY